MTDRHRILLIDDDAIFRSMVKDALSGEEFEVIEAADGGEGIRKTVVNNPDIILLDLVMPGVDGFEVCRRLRKDLNNHSVPVIILTSIEGKDNLLNAFDAGANDYLIKPFDPTELLARVRAHLRIKNIYDNSEAEKRDLKTLLDIAQVVSSSLSSREILSIIVRKVAEAVEVARCSIVKIGVDNGIGHVLTTYENPTLKYLPIELHKYPEIKRALETRETVIIDDILRDPLMEDVRDYLKGLELSSLLVIPIIVREEVIGTLFLRTSRKEKNFTQREISLCQVIANLAGNALVNAHLFESMELANLKLEKLAITDGLTGIYNHRYFRSRLEDEFNRAKRYKAPLSCIMLDIDFFKNINDAFGHAQGDVILKELADVIRHNIRKTDILARYGGEEFVILLPHTPSEGAVLEAERLRTAVKEYRCTGKDRCIMVTISLGVTTFPGTDINTVDDIVGRADDALYEAKRGGRDKVVAA